MWLISEKLLHINKYNFQRNPSRAGTLFTCFEATYVTYDDVNDGRYK
jgi:hypothetical protein